VVLHAAPQFNEAQTLQIQSAEFSAWFETWQMYNGIDKKTSVQPVFRQVNLGLLALA
jgi:hypothetical protein